MSHSPWSMVTIGRVATPVKRATEPLPGVKYRQIGVRLWGVGAYERETLDGAQTQYKELFRVETDDIIVNKIWARNGSVAVVSEALNGCYASGEFPIYAPDKEKLEPRWFHWITKTPSFWQQCDEKSHGTSGKNRIRPERFLEIEIPLPPLAEQRRIVARIEALAAKVQAARELRDEAIEKRALLLKSTLRETFRSFEKRKDCEHAILGKVTELERGKFSHRPRNDPRFFGGTHPWIQIGEIESSGKYITSYTTTLNDEGLSISRKFSKGTLLISIAATIGAVGILGFDCCVPDSIVAVIPHTDKAVSEFLYYYLTYIRGYLEEVAPQSAQKNINLRILDSLPISIPPLSEQRRIVAELDGLQARLTAVQKHQAMTQAALDALLPSILDQAFRGEL